MSFVKVLVGVSGSILGAAGAYILYNNIFREPKSKSYSMLNLPSGHHVTVAFYGRGEDGITRTEAVRRHEELKKHLGYGAVLLKTPSSVSWFGRDENIGVLELTVPNQNDFSAMFHHYSKYATRDYGDELRLHMTLHEEDDEIKESYFNRTLEATSLTTLHGESDDQIEIKSDLEKPHRKPILIKKP